jgi:RecA-family ATPase
MSGVIAFDGLEQGQAVVAVENWQAHFETGTVSAEELHQIALPHHEPLLDRWLAEGDLGFIFAARGVGKTHLALGLARALAEGGSIGPWRAPNAVPVLYVDGEMNAEQIRERDGALAKSTGALYYLNHELLFARTQKTINLARLECQNALTQLCVQRGVKVLFLDNLSTLFSGVEENNNDAWEQVLPWLLHLRKLNVTVVIVHHAGRNGQMRGASRREDSAAWVIRLDDALDGASVKRGAKFVSTFTKPSRHTPAEMPSFAWEFSPDKATGRCDVIFRAATGLEVFLQWLADGLQTCGEIANEMHTTPGTVSKLAKRGANEGRIRIERRKYYLIDGNGGGEK